MTSYPAQDQWHGETFSLLWLQQQQFGNFMNLSHVNSTLAFSTMNNESQETAQGLKTLVWPSFHCTTTCLTFNSSSRFL